MFSTLMDKRNCALLKFRLLNLYTLIRTKANVNSLRASTLTSKPEYITYIAYDWFFVFILNAKLIALHIVAAAKEMWRVSNLNLVL